MRVAGEHWAEVGAAKAGDVEGGTLKDGKQGLFSPAQRVETSEGAAVEGTGWVRRSTARMPAEKSFRLERYSR